MNELATGNLLIADPFLKDPNFQRTVVFLCEHNAEGDVGFVLNRVLENTLDEMLESMEGYAVPVYYGGPVETNGIHFLHQYPDEIPGGIEVLKGVYWGGDIDIAIQLIKTSAIDTQKIRFFLGYSGWGEGQLKEEMDEKTWLTVKSNRKLVFHPAPANLWKDALIHLGGDYEMMVNFPLDPQLN